MDENGEEEDEDEDDELAGVDLVQMYVFFCAAYFLVFP